MWNLEFDGEIGPSGLGLVFGYDDTGLTVAEELALDIFHFEDGAWTALGGTIDTINNTITATTLSLSPFGVGFADEVQPPAAGVIPEPSTLLLCGLGLGCSLVSRRLRRR